MQNRFTITHENGEIINISTDQEFIDYLNKNKTEEQRRSLVVDIINVSMGGTSLVSQISGLGYQIHPYHWGANAASAAIVHINTDNEISVALGHNILKDSKNASGIPAKLRTCGGFTNAKALGGVEGSSKFTTDIKDQAERYFINVNKTTKTDKVTAYKHIANQCGYTPSGIIKNIADKDTKATLIREALEEWQLNVENNEIHFLNKRKGESKAFDTFVDEYLVIKKTPTPPALTSDGIETGESKWIRASDFEITQDLDPKTPGKIKIKVPYKHTDESNHQIEIPIEEAIMIGRGLRRCRNIEIKECSRVKANYLFKNTQNVEAQIDLQLGTDQTLEDILGESPETHFKNIIDLNSLPGDSDHEKEKNYRALTCLGAHANNYHKKIIEQVKIIVSSSQSKMKEIKLSAHPNSTFNSQQNKAGETSVFAESTSLLRL